MGISDEWTALQFDRAVYAFGKKIDKRLSETDKKGKPKWTIEQALQDKPTTGLFQQWIDSIPFEKTPLQ